MIRYENITLNFGPKNIFKDLSLEITKGQKVVLLGKSGIGKSSLFSLLLGFVRPQAGRIVFKEEVIDEHSVWGLRQKVCFVDQDVSISGHTFRDWLAFAESIKANRSLDFSPEAVNGVLDLFELNHDILDQGIAELSGGQRQRAALVIAVLLKRDIFLLDEVTSALDKDLKKKVADFFMKKKDWTVISISNDPAWLENPQTKIFDLEKKTWQQ